MKYSIKENIFDRTEHSTLHKKQTTLTERSSKPRFLPPDGD